LGVSLLPPGRPAPRGNHGRVARGGHCPQAEATVERGTEVGQSVAETDALEVRQYDRAVLFPDAAAHEVGDPRREAARPASARGQETRGVRGKGRVQVVMLAEERPRRTRATNNLKLDVRATLK